MLAGQTVKSFRVCAFASERPENVRKVLLDERYLSLHREFYIIQRCAGPKIRRDAGEYPAASFLVHQTTRAVDGVHDDSPHNIRLSSSARQNNLTIFQTLGDKQHRRNRRHLTLEEFNEHFFADTIECEDRVAFLLAYHLCHLAQRRAFASLNHCGTNLLVQLPHWPKQLSNVVHFRELLLFVMDVGLRAQLSGLLIR